MLHRLSTQKFRHAYLLAALFLILLVRPFVERSSPVDVPYISELRDVTIINTLFGVTLFAGAFAAARSRAQLVTICSLAAVSTLLNHLPHGDVGDQVRVAHNIVTFVYFCVLLSALARPFFGPLERVSVDTIFGALSIYLLLGLGWSWLYAALEHIEPGSFTLPPGDALAATDGTQFERFIGFSFTTLTTLGYGNIVPTNPRADALTSVEAIVGQIYLAVVLARLVAIHTTQPRLAGAGELESGADRPPGA